MKPFHLLILAGSLFHAGAAGAAQYFLSAGGSDSQLGTLESPWKTFAHAGGQLAAGDTLNLRAGSYGERLVLIGKSGTVAAPIVIRPYLEETVAIDGAALTVPAGGRAGLVALTDCNHVIISGITIRDFKTADSSRTPAGILIEGGGEGVRISSCTVSGIWQSSTSTAGNGFGIAVYGTKSTSISNLVLDGNEVHDLRTGQSESVVLNGNVRNFQVLRNHVHHCNNIGIDFIGYEGSAPAAVDRAREGICRENLVHDIDSAFNPGYNGNFATGGGDESAAGIYVDGGSDIVIERNRVRRCNFGIELASENAAGFTDRIVMRDNLLDHNFGPGIIMGGYDSNRGTTKLCEVRNTTLYRNDSRRTYGGQIALQFYLKDNVFLNNVVWTDSVTKQAIVHYVEGGTAALRAFDKGTNRFDYNIYFGSGNAGDIEFGLNPTGGGGNAGNKSYNGLAAWQAAVDGEAHSIFGNPGFAVPSPGVDGEPADYKIAPGSLARDRGEPSPPFVETAGEMDFFGSSRIANGRIDAGMHEYLDDSQTWRDLYFKLPDGGPGANDGDDPDADGFANLMEYSQGMNPTIGDTELGPNGAMVGGLLRFNYRRNVADLSYVVQTSADLVNWPPAVVAEQKDSMGNYWRDFPLAGGAPFFTRLRVSR